MDSAGIMEKNMGAIVYSMCCGLLRILHLVTEGQAERLGLLPGARLVAVGGEAIPPPPPEACLRAASSSHRKNVEELQHQQSSHVLPGAVSLSTTLAII